MLHTAVLKRVTNTVKIMTRSADVTHIMLQQVTNTVKMT